VDVFRVLGKHRRCNQERRCKAVTESTKVNNFCYCRQMKITPQGSILTSVGLIAFAALGSARPANAEVLWSTYGPALVQGYEQTPAHENAEDFVLATGAAITSLDWSGVYINNTLPTDNFTVEIFGDDGGQPASTAEFIADGTITRTDTGTTVLGHEIYDYTDVLTTPLGIAAGTYYFDPLDKPSSDAFFWGVVSTTSGDIWVRGNPSLPSVGAGSESASTMAFEVDGTATPEPALGPACGLILLALVARSIGRGRRIES